MLYKKGLAVSLILLAIAGLPGVKAAPEAPGKVYDYVLKPALPEADALLEAFFGDDKAKMTQRDAQDGELSFATDDWSYDFDYKPSTGFFLLSRPSLIPTHYRTDGEGASLPPPSKEPGKYSAQEADERAREALHQLLGLEREALSTTRIIHENPEKEKSRAYRIMYHYELEGLPLIPVSGAFYSPTIEVGITDDGLAYAKGVCLEVVSKEEGTNNVLTLADMIRLNPWMQSFGTHELGYYLQPGEAGSFTTRPVWYAYNPESWSSGHVYSATSGKQIPVE